MKKANEQPRPTTQGGSQCHATADASADCAMRGKAMDERRKPTNGDAGKWELTPQQATAVDLLAAGRTVTETAEAVGVVRQTVSEWLNQQDGFRAAVNQRRHELWTAVTDRLRSLVPKALDVLEEGLTAGNVQAALGLLKAAGLYGLAAPSGPTTPEAIEAERVRSEKLAAFMAF
jgi:hypothetical protein